MKESSVSEKTGACVVLVALLMAIPIASAVNVYVDNNPARFEALPADQYGWLEVRVRGVTVQDPYVLVVRQGTDVNLTYLPDHSEDVQNQNPGAMVIKVLTDGVSKPELMATGKYRAYLRQGNADQPESIDFEIGNQDTTRLSFMGAAVPTVDMGCCACRNVTIVDVPGTVIHHPEQNHTVHYEYAVTAHMATTIIDEHTVIVEMLPAHCEHVVQTPAHWEYKASISSDWIWLWNVPVPEGCIDVTDDGGNINLPSVSRESVRCKTKPQCFVRYIQESSKTECFPAVTQTIHYNSVYQVAPDTTVYVWDEVVVDKPAWDEEIGAITHEERVCGKKDVCPCGCVKPKVN